MSGMTTISDVRERLGTCSGAVELVGVNPAKQKHGENMRENPARKGWCLSEEKVELSGAKIKNALRKQLQRTRGLTEKLPFEAALAQNLSEPMESKPFRR